MQDINSMVTKEFMELIGEELMGENEDNWLDNRTRAMANVCFKYLQSHPSLAMEIAGMKWREYPKEKPEKGDHIVYAERLSGHDFYSYLYGAYQYHFESNNIKYWIRLPSLPEKE